MMDNDKYKIFTYDSSYDDKIAALQSHLWKGDIQLNSAYFNWKYKQNPYIDTPLIFLITYLDELVGMMGLMGSEWEVGKSNDRYLCLCASDLVFAPDHRGCGLFKPLWDSVFTHISKSEFLYLFILSGHKKSIRITMDLGWSSIGSLEKLNYSNQPRSIVSKTQRYFRRLQKQRSKTKLSAYAAPDQRSARNPDRRVRVEKEPRPISMSKLISQLGHDGRIRHVRDERYLGWRYQNPFSEYRFLFWGDAELEGYLVLQTPFNADPEHASVNIVDWEGSSMTVKSDLLQAAIEWGSFNKISIWSATLPAAEKELISSIGFSPQAEVDQTIPYPTVLVKPTDLRKPEGEWYLGDRSVLDLKDWDIRGVYSEGF